MITYAYHCDACGSDFQIRRSITEDRSDVLCDCGAVPEQLVTGGNCTAVFGRDEYKFDPRRNARTYKGRSAAREEKVYARRVTEMQQRAREFNKVKRSDADDWKVEAIAPAPLVDSINDREGDKNKVLMDPKPFMKDTGCWVGED